MRLPSFNDFSPRILDGDIRECLRVIAQHPGDDATIIAEWSTRFFGGKTNKRASTNIPATLSSTGLTTGTRPLQLSEFGKDVLGSSDAKEAATKFVTKLILENNGNLLVDALQSLAARKESATKKNLKAELVRLGVTDLSTNTTDHTTFRNWMIFAGLVTPDGAPVDAALKTALGISASERDEFYSLSLAQQVFLAELRKRHEVEPGPFLFSDLRASCTAAQPYLFDESQLARQVRKPLEDAGWIDTVGVPTGPQGGRSGWVSGTTKLLSIPVELVMPDFDQTVPSDLRAKIDTPLSVIKTDLFGKDKYKGGLALELLTVRMIIDLGLWPRHFRIRAAQSAYAEVDVVAEGAHLHFSRWTFQCKRHNAGSAAKVTLSDVAKEVGIAVFARAHVVVMVTTSDATKDARAYAEEVSRATPLQFVFVDGAVIKAYLKKGASSLHDYFTANARAVLAMKHDQPLPNT